MPPTAEESDAQLDLASLAPACAQCLGETAEMLFGTAGCQLRGRLDDCPSGLLSTCIPVKIGSTPVQIGLGASLQVCGELTCAMLGAEDPSEFEESELVDSLGELANVLAGQLKTQLSGVYSPIELGLPFVLSGDVKPSQHVRLLQFGVTVGSWDVVLLLLQPASSAGRAQSSAA